MYDGGSRSKVESVHLTLAEANTAARRVYKRFPMKDMEEVNCDEDGKPFDAFCCYEMGAGSVMVTVDRPCPWEMSAPMLKKALKMVGQDGVGTKQALQDQLEEFLKVFDAEHSEEGTCHGKMGQEDEAEGGNGKRSGEEGEVGGGNPKKLKQ